MLNQYCGFLFGFQDMYVFSSPDDGDIVVRWWDKGHLGLSRYIFLNKLPISSISPEIGSSGKALH